MNIYDAIMKAANQIGRNPSTFDYERAHLGCGSKACAIGWIAHYAGESREDAFGPLNTRTPRLLGVPYWPDQGYEAFENRMTRLVPEWKSSASLCSEALRLYAAKYHATTPAKRLRTDAELVSYWTAYVRQMPLDQHAKSQELA